MEPLAQSDFPGPLQGGDRRGRGRVVVVSGVVPADVPGDVWIHRGDEGGDVAKLGVRVVLARDHQGGDLDPDACIVVGLDGVEHRREPGRAELLVEALGEGLEIDVGRVDHPLQLGGYHVRGGIPVGDHGVGQTLFMGLDRRVQGVLQVDRGLGVGIRDTPAAGLHGGGHHLVGGELVARDSASLDGVLGDVVVLAEAAAQVAPHRGYGERLRAGQEVEQGLLLDGVDVGGHAPSPHERDERAAVVLPHPADAHLAVGDEAVVRAEHAPHLVPGGLLPEPGMLHVSLRTSLPCPRTGSCARSA